MFVYVALLGLVTGSFLSALTYRLPRGIKISSGRSLCVNCKKTIAWYDNIPLLSYLILKGKCRKCKKKISPRYFVIELATALLFTAIYLATLKCAGAAYLTNAWNGAICNINNNLGIWTLPYLLILSSALLAIFITDFEYQIIPDQLVIFLLFLVFLTHFFSTADNFYALIFSGFSAALFFLFLNIVTGGRGMGLGDAKLGLVGGLFFGLGNSFYWLTVSFILGAVVGLILIFSGKAKFGKPIPFGPFLIAGYIITMLFSTKFPIINL